VKKSLAANDFCGSSMSEQSVDLPAPQPEEVRVKVLAAGVSLPDVLAREDVAPP